ncbi:cysteine-rich venom protein 1-like isoform X1 [Bufo gargarizans]|uniref:cysteine-rich venom protein 1-like isoform X1 n=1 Tax=Bufo gargarizans TaxID=30331 RepID=UPI001CF12992|nr:cysteine-rich venom protein 1-like isoform X1 [Bufo gargarizans]
MTRTTTLLLISLGVLLALVTAQSIPDCTDGKVYTDCGTNCPPTCKKPNPACNYMCVPGCFCPNGTVQTVWGECVEKDKCGDCSGNTTYSNCANNCPGVPSPPNCLRKACVEGCACNPDYALIPGTKRCVLPQDLPKVGSNK